MMERIASLWSGRMNKMDSPGMWLAFGFFNATSMLQSRQYQAIGKMAHQMDNKNPAPKPTSFNQKRLMEKWTTPKIYPPSSRGRMERGCGAKISGTMAIQATMLQFNGGNAIAKRMPEKTAAAIRQKSNVPTAYARLFSSLESISL